MEVRPGQSPETPDEPAKAYTLKETARHEVKTEGLESVVAQAIDVKELQEQLDPIFIEQLEAWGNATLTDLGIAQSFSMVDPFVVSHLQNFSGTKIVGINETTQEKVRNALQEGIRDGDGVPQLANRITGVFEKARKSRAILIARTEVVGSSNFGTFNAYKQSGVVPRKEWVSTLDDRVRDTHLEMNGKIVPLDRPFVLPDGAQCMYPGETGTPENDCNERCTIVAVVDNEFSEAQLVTIWRKYDKAIVPWEKQTIQAARRAFRAQEKAAIKVLRSVMG